MKGSRGMVIKIPNDHLTSWTPGLTILNLLLGVALVLVGAVSLLCPNLKVRIVNFKFS